MVRKIKNIDTFYCNIDDLKNCYLYRDVNYKDGTLSVATQLTDKMLDTIKNGGVKNFAIVNENEKTYYVNDVFDPGRNGILRTDRAKAP